MAREREDYRPILERLDIAFPGREMLKKVDVSRFTGMCHRSVIKHFGKDFTGNYISKETLARRMSGGGQSAYFSR
jgi:hypothetical protein